MNVAVLDVGKTNVKAQQREEPEPPERPDYLFEPLAGDRGPHGDFDSEAKGTSAQLWATMHRGGLLAGAGLAGVAALGALLRR